MADCMDDISKALACCTNVSFLSDAEIQKHASANFSTSTAAGSPFIPEFGSSIRNPQAEFNKRTIHKGDCDFVRARARRNWLLHMDSSRICYLLLLVFSRASGVHASPLILCSFWVQRTRWEEKTSSAVRTGPSFPGLISDAGHYFGSRPQPQPRPRPCSLLQISDHPQFLLLMDRGH